jgi:acyl-CoA reductase-like NAD-dependent aldehyde dehydrogenase
VDTCDYLGFTGSSRTGALIAARAGERLIGCSLELGGKNPMIVLDDADIAATAASAVRGCFANAGQLCLSLERIYVPDAIFDRFADAFVAAVIRLRQEKGYAYGADLGSLTSQRALKTVSEHVDDARAKGATVLAGGRPRPDLGPYFYEPTVLTDVTPDMLCHTAETFGPVVSLYPYATEDEAVSLANATDYGLNASVHGRDLVRARQVAARLRTGTVNVNDGYASAFGSTDAPMGGMGMSGLGRRHGAEGLLRYTEVQSVAAQQVDMLNPPRWLPYRAYSRFMAAALRLMKKTRLR